MKKIIITSAITIVVLLFSLLFFEPVLKNISYGIDLQGGFEVIYKIESLIEGDKLTNDDLDKTYKAISNRIDTLGVSEPVISFEGKDILRIQLPGVSNEEEARERISTTAVLSFRDVEDNILMTSEILGNNGASLDKSSKSLLPVVKLDIKDKNAFYQATKEISKRKNEENRIIIWLDFEEEVDSFEKSKDDCGKQGNMKCISAPFVNKALNESSVIIEGNFSNKEAQNLVDLINSGSLPTKLVEESTPRSVSASFGNETITKAAIAGLVTFIIIILLMTFKYRVSGFISSLCLIIYSLVVFLLFNAIGGVLTITGIAALVLGIGMAVDSAVLSIERIKEEAEENKNMLGAFKEGAKKSLVAIIDANITTLLVAIILYMYGESAVRGFATMLIITIFVTILTMVIMNRFVLKEFIKTGFFKDKKEMFLGKFKKQSKFNFIKTSKFQILSALLIIFVGIILMFTNKINLGVDFSGGTNINLISENNINFKEIIKYVEEYEVVDYNTYLNKEKEGYIKLNTILNSEEELKIKEDFKKLSINVSISEISTRVTKNLTHNAILSFIIASIAIIIYMTIRFDINYAISGLIALFHDVLITLSIFIILGLEFNFIIIAALLTIIGYSINDTIVIFDRIRENREKVYKNNIKSENELIDLANLSTNETLSRNIQTSLSTIVAVIILFALGINEIHTFNVSMFIGLVAGTFSTLFMAPRIWLYLETKKLKNPNKYKEEEELEEKSIKGVNS